MTGSFIQAGNSTTSAQSSPRPSWRSIFYGQLLLLSSQHFCRRDESFGSGCRLPLARRFIVIDGCYSAAFLTAFVLPSVVLSSVRRGICVPSLPPKAG